MVRVSTEGHRRATDRGRRDVVRLRRQGTRPIIDDSDGPEERLADHFIGRPGVGRKKAFGRECLTVNGKIFVVFRLGEIVVKLPIEEGRALIESGEAGQFEPAPSRAMKSWFTFGPEVDEDRWIQLAERAFEYILELQS